MKLKLFKRKKKISQKDIPKDVLNDFEEIQKEFERRNKETNGKCNPYTVLYDFAKRRAISEGYGGEFREPEQSIAGRVISTEPIRREGIQIESPKRDEENIAGTREVKRNNSRSYLRRFIRNRPSING